ncbi:substrate-binding domain-containing protein [Azotobacter salinestris]|uniref:substrate-binding domain-containing protein n=1 Tax=Azotobacter salinestris TaxID=69964 RepID=UPI001FCAF7AE|nr:substrate-binding domain-containing protein [Azotobacter salinestris]
MKGSLPLCRLSAAGLLCGLLLALPAGAEPLRFALVAKRMDQSFYAMAGEGCAEAAQAEGDTCLLLGPLGTQHFREQNKVLRQTLARNDLDGIGLAVTHSEWLAKHALKGAGRIPLIAFNSDLAPAEQHLRRSYVGLDNLRFGRQLAMLAQRFRPQGGKLCILSGGIQNTNHLERIQGIRQQLRGKRTEDGATGRLKGENGWSEANRCPLYDNNDPAIARLRLATLLAPGSQLDVILVLGNWPLCEADEYRKQIGPLLAELDKQGWRPVIIVATHKMDAAQRALLDDGLAQAYLNMEGREIGRQSYRMLKRLVQGEPVPEKVFVASHVYLPGVPPAIAPEP